MAERKEEEEEEEDKEERPGKDVILFIVHTVDRLPIAVGGRTHGIGNQGLNERMNEESEELGKKAYGVYFVRLPVVRQTWYFPTVRATLPYFVHYTGR